MSFSVNTGAKVKDVALEILLGRPVGVTATGCWLWTGTVDRKGYGFIIATLSLMTRKYSAHRLSYEYYKGKPSLGLVVRHRCHVRRCINPHHLTLGSPAENTQDMITAFRAPWQRKKGESLNLESPEIIEYKDLPPSERAGLSWFATPKPVEEVREPSAEIKQLFENDRLRLREKLKKTRQAKLDAGK